MKPARTPDGATSRNGGSLKPSSGMISLSVSTNDSGPQNSIPPKTTSTSGLPEDPARNASRSKRIFMSDAGAISVSEKSSSSATASKLAPVFTPARASTAIRSGLLARKIGSSASAGHLPSSVVHSSFARTSRFSGSRPWTKAMTWSTASSMPAM